MCCVEVNSHMNTIDLGARIAIPHLCFVVPTAMFQLRDEGSSMAA